MRHICCCLPLAHNCLWCCNYSICHSNQGKQLGRFDVARSPANYTWLTWLELLCCRKHNSVLCCFRCNIVFTHGRLALKFHFVLVQRVSLGRAKWRFATIALDVCRHERHVIKFISSKPFYHAFTTPISEQYGCDSAIEFNRKITPLHYTLWLAVMHAK